MVDFTHDPGRDSWVDPPAGGSDADFPLQNLPFGVYRTRDSEPGRIGVAIHDQIVDLASLSRAGLLRPDAAAAEAAFQAETLNAFLALDDSVWLRVRSRLSRLLGPEADRHVRDTVRGVLVAQRDVQMLLPVAIGDFSDFYASIHHATRVGRMMRPEAPLLPNYKWVPIGYHGRASSVVVSGTPVVRPHGQMKPEGAPAPVFGPSRRLDYELELGAYIGGGNSIGSVIPIAEAPRHLFGLSLLNDWSARDVQAWESQPLGPFLSKSFASTVSAWVVTRQALEPFRAPQEARAAGDPEPLPYLVPPEANLSAFDIDLDAFLTSAAMRRQALPPVAVAASSARHLYWGFDQIIAHHASNGCNLRPGDLLGCGTVSGPGPNARACLLELTARGAEPLVLPTAETRTFLEDGDEVTLRARAVRPGFRSIGFGECRGLIVPAEDATARVLRC